MGFDYDEGHKEQSITALAGIPLLVQAFRSLGLPASVKRNVSVKQRERGYDEATFVESFVVLNAAGGECLDDFAHLRKDAVGELIGHPYPVRKRRAIFCTSSMTLDHGAIQIDGRDLLRLSTPG